MDVKQKLRQLPEPDPDALDRVWTRYRQTRAGASRRGFAWPALTLVGVGMAMAAAALFAVGLPSDAPRRAVLASNTGTSIERWTDEVELTFEGHGEIAGTGRDAEVRWESGTVTASVEPRSGNHLTVVTEEARVEVVGTVFSVTRDPSMGVTTRVERGRVKVTCADGWVGEIGPEDGERLCLPVDPGLLYARAARLEAAGAPLAEQLASLDAGLARVEEGSATEDQLLFKRLNVRRDAGDRAGVYRDADRYLVVPRSRATEVRQIAAWTAMSAGAEGCERALPYLSGLEIAGVPEDRVLLAGCVAPDQPKLAARLLDDALPLLPPVWQERARALRGTLPR